MILEIEIFAIALPFFGMVYSMHGKLEKMCTVIELCPNCPRRKYE